MKSYGLMAALAGAVSLWGAGAEVSGKVTLEGTPPKEIQIRFDPLCGKLHNEPVTTQHWVVGPDGGLKDVFVYIKEVPGGKTYEPPADKVPVLDQVKCLYTPYVSGVMVNQKFKIRNSDPLMHNVHATPKVAGNKEFNVAQPVKGMEYVTSFPKREVLLRFKCDVHPWMFAYVGVMDHPWFAVTNEKGEYKLPAGLPPGEYTLVAYHRKAGELTQKITVKDGEKKVVNFTMKVPQR
ncbi:MAG: hypothetical protein D6766_10265 [Verrucomicrobia bacterium]|nr:MAG: hypothetical protein D6766_10265 [Verrucomicrobiota bacterium]